MTISTQTVTNADRSYTVEVSDRWAEGTPRGWFTARVSGCATRAGSGPDAKIVMERAVAAVLTGYFDDEMDELAA
jgi:hypothetical protein